MLDLEKKGWEAAMPLSHLKLSRLSAILLVLGTLGWAADPVPAGNARVTLEPRSKTPAANNIVTQRANIRVDSTLVLIPVTVTDPFNRFVTGLDKENFKLLEDKKEQEIVAFTSEDAPLSVGVVFDCSGSMGNKLEKSRQAVTQFFKTANPEDEFFLVV